MNKTFFSSGLIFQDPRTEQRFNLEKGDGSQRKHGGNIYRDPGKYKGGHYKQTSKRWTKARASQGRFPIFRSQCPNVEQTEIEFTLPALATASKFP